jgi:acetyl esterase/lipase
VNPGRSEKLSVFIILNQIAFKRSPANFVHTIQHSMISKLYYTGYWLFIFCSFPLAAQVKTVEFARYENGTVLSMDIYEPQSKRQPLPGSSSSLSPIVICIFAGGFAAGSRKATLYQPYYEFLSNQGYVVAAIDYRLGLKGTKKPPSIFNRKPLVNAISIAVQDLYAATNYLLHNAEALQIDSESVILSGASSGAIIALQGDYEKRNKMKNAQALPVGFQYAGVISFAGAIYSQEWKPDYDTPPAPTLLFHGSKDNWVPYNKVSFLRTGIYGSKSLAKRRKKQGYPYCFYSFENVRHDVAGFPMHEYQPQILSFLQEFVHLKKRLYIDINIKDEERKESFKDNPSDMYKRP